MSRKGGSTQSAGFSALHKRIQPPVVSSPTRASGLWQPTQPDCNGMPAGRGNRNRHASAATWCHTRRGIARAAAGGPRQRRSGLPPDVPIHLTGLGTVQATFTVGIHSQVDGKLQDVFFKEGQRVKKGDVLAKIDPRLFQAALDQAKAKKAQDEAQLASFQKDLAASRRSAPRASRRSRTSTSSRPRSTPPRPRLPPTRPRSKPRRRNSTTPTSKRRATDAWACAWSIRATSCMPPIKARSRSWCRRSPRPFCSRCRRKRSTTCARRRSAAPSRWSPTTATTAAR